MPKQWRRPRAPWQNGFAERLIVALGGRSDEIDCGRIAATNNDGDTSNFAASSLVILKNSFHLAMMIASLNDSKFALPRFMMFDNIEDKGMRPDRSHNFQSLIANVSSAAPTKHQIIFTTSMLSPDLRRSPYLVGPEYSKQNKTLNIH